jgi:WD40 repeat protein
VLIFWDVTTGKANERLEPEKFASVVYQSGHLKHAKQSQSFKYGPPPWCQIKTFETVSFSPNRPIIIVGGSGILVSGSGIDVHPYPESYGGGPCYLVAAWHLINQVMLESVGPFDSKEFPNAQNFALQATIEPNNSFSGLLVMDSGFYPLTSGSRFNDKYGRLKTTDFGLDFAVFAMTGAAISPNAERVAVWGKTRGEQAMYFLNLYDVRTTQQIAQFSLESDSTLSTLSAAFRPDGRMLASLDQNGNLKLWQVKKTLP